MKRSKYLGLLVSGLLVGSVQAATVWYQPTPYPLKKFDGTDMPQDLNIVHIWDGWFGSYYNTTSLTRDDKLQIGGWGDTYVSLVQLDLAGLPTSVDDAYLYLYAQPSGAANPSQVSLFPITSTWNPSTVGWYNWPSLNNGYLWPVSTSVNAWRSYWLTWMYNDWKVGTNKGVFMWPYNNDGQQRFDKFASSRVTNDAIRPILMLNFTPTLELKMPLSGNLSWLVTTEVGGYDCRGAFDQYHADSTGNYFSIDFSWRNKDASGTQVYPNPDPNNDRGNHGVYIPVRAAAGGKVVDAKNSSGNGYYVTIDHDGDGNLETGFSTRYLHLQPPGAIIAEQETVQQGDIIGYVGNTGISDGAHLHFGVRYANSGLSSVPQLAKVIMEGKLLKSYQSECLTNESGWPTSWNRYYPSTNSTP